MNLFKQKHIQHAVELLQRFCRDIHKTLRDTCKNCKPVTLNTPEFIDRAVKVCC